MSLILARGTARLLPWQRPGQWSPRVSSRRSLSSSASPAKKEPPTKPEIEIPTNEQLRIVALRYAIPMIGFGFMDNLVMCTAGEAIDRTFGVALGISTMVAAGFGQCFSDVAGNLTGGAVEAGVQKLKLPHHGLTENQLDLGVSRAYRLAGACVGVVTGCLLGMTCLLFMDTDAADRARKANELKTIFEHVVLHGKSYFHAERASLFLFDEEKHEFWSTVATGSDDAVMKNMIIKVKADKGILGACAKSGELLNVADAYEDDRFDASIDKETNFRTRSVLAMPVKDDDGNIIGAIQMINKKLKDGSDATFTSEDETMLEMMASHVTSFISIVG